MPREGRSLARVPALRSSCRGVRASALDLKQARVGGDSPMSMYVTTWQIAGCGALWTTGVAHLKRASEITAGCRMSAATLDLRRASHKGRLIKV